LLVPRYSAILTPVQVGVALVVPGGTAAVDQAVGVDGVNGVAVGFGGAFVLPIMQLESQRPLTLLFCVMFAAIGG
jgi:hypothetical protein